MNPPHNHIQSFTPHIQNKIPTFTHNIQNQNTPHTFGINTNLSTQNIGLQTSNMGPYHNACNIETSGQHANINKEKLFNKKVMSISL